MTLYSMEDAAGARILTRNIPDRFVDNSVLTSLALFQRTFARLVAFYGWDEKFLVEFGDHVSDAFPDHFRYRT
jgi:hypothetical protein